MGNYPVINILQQKPKSQQTLMKDHPEAFYNLIDSCCLDIFNCDSKFKHPISNDVTNLYDVVNSCTVIDTLDEFNSKLYWDPIDNAIESISNEDGDIIRLTTVKIFVDKLSKIDKNDDDYEQSQDILNRLNDLPLQPNDIILIGAL